MSLGDEFKDADNPKCNDCVFYHALPSQPGTCNLNPPQVVSHEGKLHYLFPTVAPDWYCGHFASKT